MFKATKTSVKVEKFEKLRMRDSSVLLVVSN